MTVSYSPQTQWNAEAKLQRMLVDFDRINGDIETTIARFSESGGDEFGALQWRKFRLMQDIVATARVLVS